jgi:hypothetical protein
MDIMTEYKLGIRGTEDRAVLVVIPGLAAEIGLNEAILLRQFVHWIKTSKNFRDGEWWTYQSLSDIFKKLKGAMTLGTIQRTVKRLIETGLLKVETKYNRRKHDKKRWFALCPDALATLKSIRLIAIDPETGAESEWIDPQKSMAAGFSRWIEARSILDRDSNQNEASPLHSDSMPNHRDSDSIHSDSTLPESTDIPSEVLSEKSSPEIAQKETASAIESISSPPGDLNLAAENAPEPPASRQSDSPTEPVGQPPPVPPPPPTIAAAISDEERAKRAEAARPARDLFESDIAPLYPGAVDAINGWVAEYGLELVMECLKDAINHDGRSVAYVRTVIETHLNKRHREAVEAKRMGLTFLLEDTAEFDADAYRARAEAGRLEREGPPPPPKSPPPDGLTAADVVDYETARKEVNELRKRQSSAYVEVFMLLVEVFEYRNWNVALCEWIADQMRNKRPITLMQIYDLVNRPAFPRKVTAFAPTAPAAPRATGAKVVNMVDAQARADAEAVR